MSAHPSGDARRFEIPRAGSTNGASTRLICLEDFISFSVSPPSLYFLLPAPAPAATAILPPLGRPANANAGNRGCEKKLMVAVNKKKKKLLVQLLLDYDDVYDRICKNT